MKRPPPRTVPKAKLTQTLSGACGRRQRLRYERRRQAADGRPANPVRSGRKQPQRVAYGSPFCLHLPLLSEVAPRKGLAEHRVPQQRAIVGDFTDEGAQQARHFLGALPVRRVAGGAHGVEAR